MQNVNSTPVSSIHINSSFLMMDSKWSYNPSGGLSYEGMGTKCSSVRRVHCQKDMEILPPTGKMSWNTSTIYTFIALLFLPLDYSLVVTLLTVLTDCRAMVILTLKLPNINWFFVLGQQRLLAVNLISLLISIGGANGANTPRCIT